MIDPRRHGELRFRFFPMVSGFEKCTLAQTTRRPVLGLSFLRYIGNRYIANARPC